MDGDFDRETGEIEVRRPAPATMPTQGERNLIFASPECGEIFGALAEAQGNMGNPKKTKTAKVQGTTKSGGSYNYDYKYAPLEEVVDVIRKPMSDAGLVYRQFLAQRDSNWVMRTIIAHRSGQWYGCDYPLFADRPGAQGFASGVTYARRYGLMLALGLVGEDDDDANVADGNPVEVSGKPNAARTAQERPPAARAAPQRQQAAPASTEAQTDARKRWRELRDAIDASMTLDELNGITGCPAWITCAEKILAVEGSQAKADGMMALLSDRIEGQRQFLLGSTG
jgi:hypothetical protein